MKWIISKQAWSSKNFLQQIKGEYYLCWMSNRNVELMVRGAVDSEEKKGGIVSPERVNVIRGEMYWREVGNKFVSKARSQELSSSWNDFCNDYCRLMAGDLSVGDDFCYWLPHRSGLKFFFHVWEQFLAGKTSNKVWGYVLSHFWRYGYLTSHTTLPTNVLIKMFASAGKQTLLDPEYEDEVKPKLKFFEALPETLTIWRGTTSMAKFGGDGFSWTVHKRIAEFYAYENWGSKRKRPILLEAEVKKADIFTVFPEDSEIVVNPSLKTRPKLKHTIYLPHYVLLKSGEVTLQTDNASFNSCGDKTADPAAKHNVLRPRYNNNVIALFPSQGF